MQKTNPKKRLRKPQHQRRPGTESRMHPAPIFDDPQSHGSGKLKGKIAVITGGDSGIGRAIATLFAKEGADIAILYLNEHGDANETKRIVEEYGVACMLIPGDISVEKFCAKAIHKVIKKWKRIDVLINNAAIHYEHTNIKDITTEHLMTTFKTNVFAMFYLIKDAIDYMPEGSSIINTTSVVAYRGSPALIDYASTKGAIVSFTRSLSAALVDKKIRVNAVAPGPIWTPLITASFKSSKVAKHGSDVPMKRAGEPVEIAPCYLLLASNDGAYMTGQVLHPNGGEIVNG